MCATYEEKKFFQGYFVQSLFLKMTARWIVIESTAILALAQFENFVISQEFYLISMKLFSQGMPVDQQCEFNYH